MTRKKHVNPPCDICAKPGYACAVTECESITCGAHGDWSVIYQGYTCMSCYHRLRNERYPGPDYWLITTEEGEYSSFSVGIIVLEDTRLKALQAAVKFLQSREKDDVRPIQMWDHPTGCFSMGHGFGPYDVMVTIAPMRIGERMVEYG